MRLIVDYAIRIDAVRLGHDLAMRWVVGGRAIAKPAASTSQMAEVAVPRDLFEEILRLIAELRGPPAPA